MSSVLLLVSLAVILCCFVPVISCRRATISVPSSSDHETVVNLSSTDPLFVKTMGYDLTMQNILENSLFEPRRRRVSPEHFDVILYWLLYFFLLIHNLGGGVLWGVFRATIGFSRLDVFQRSIEQFKLHSLHQVL